MTQLDRVLAALMEAPSTSAELAAVTGLPAKHCSHYLRQLWLGGLARRKRMPLRGGRGPCREYLYRAA